MLTPFTLLKWLAMRNRQKRVLIFMVAACIIVNIAAVASAFWRDSELKEAGISIEQILQEGRR